MSRPCRASERERDENLHRKLPLWREPAEGKIAEQYSRNIVYKQGGDQGGWSITKMLRLPGTINHKSDYTPNRITRDVRAAAQRHGAKAMKQLVKLMEDTDPRVALAATREILDRAYGRPVSPQEITGKDGVPFHAPDVDMTTRAGKLQVAKSLAFVLAKGERALDEAIALGEAGPNVFPIPKGNRNAG